MILIVDDDYSITASLGLLLKQAGFAHCTAASPAEAIERAQSPEVALVLQDMNFSRRTSGQEGLELLRKIRVLRPELPVVLITAWGSIGLAVEGMKAGAADFITKPWTRDQILSSVRTALDLVAARSEPFYERAELDRQYDLRDIVGTDQSLLDVLRLIGRVAPTDATVLISGPSGTGKERIAEAIHRNSRRSAGPFVKVNLGAVPSALFESEMFGHVRGAFTNAHQDRIGRFASAQHGTILLDEVGDLDPTCQVKLLRVLQDRTYEPVGSSQTRTLDIRVVAATNHDLKAAVAAGTFREDLLYRLNLIHVHMPSLAERSRDIGALAAHFLARAAERYGRRELELSAAALRWLETQSWPGNVRQLEHVIERAVLVSESDVIEVDALRAYGGPGMDSHRSAGRADADSASFRPGADKVDTARHGTGADPTSLAGVERGRAGRAELGSEDRSAIGGRDGSEDRISFQNPPAPSGRTDESESMTVQEMERTLIERSLLHHGGNLSKVADSLGISRQALYRRLSKYGIEH